MDLSEIRDGVGRHPWELARAEALVRLLARRRERFEDVLDFGCGDGFTGREVQRRFSARSLVGVDIRMGEVTCGTQPVAEGTWETLRDEGALGPRRFDLLLLCDVIEHVEDDRAFIRSLSARRLRPDALVLVTVPAFQTLFSDHDRALRHHRRYSLPALRATLAECELTILDDGYLFASLLAVRALLNARDRIFRRPFGAHGIGGWAGGAALTRGLTSVLRADNVLLAEARRAGIVLPGLTAWALCRPSRAVL